MRMSRLLSVMLLIAASAYPCWGQSALSLGTPFQDHAVVQRDVPIPMWGVAGPGETVTATFAGREATARADASGRWALTLPAMAAGGPHALEVRSASGASRQVADVLVGDVFLCSGQSNMEFGVAGSAGGEFAASRSANNRIRLMTVPHSAQPQPAPFDSLKWQIASPESVRPFSAACYFFGVEVERNQNVPVGLVNASWGGTAIEPWIGEAGLRTLGRFDTMLDVLQTFAHDENAANQAFGRIWEDWWRSRGATADEPWRPDAAGSWTVVPGLRNWKTWGVPELATHDGMVWYRRSFTVSAAQASGAATLSLGGIDEVDETWINGHPVRNTFGWGSPRTYTLAPGSLHAGENVLVVNVLSTWDAGGMLGPADAISLTASDGTKVPLGDGWQYRTVPLSMGRPPRAPWEPIAGLTTLYNAMIAPLGPMRLRGVAWYQGETNADSPAGYDSLLGALMTSWRLQFGSALPFLVVQLPNFGEVPAKPTEAKWADLRELQREAVAADQHAGLVVTIDIGEPGELHPANKRDVGRRLWRAARHLIYGEAVTPSGPWPVSAHRDSGRVVVDFRDVEGTLVTYSSNAAIAFELCGAEGGSCQYVPGTVEGTHIVLPISGDRAEAPSRVRFCWGASPVCNLSDGSRLPVTPFELSIK